MLLSLVSSLLSSPVCSCVCVVTCMHVGTCMQLYACVQLYELGLDSLLTLAPSVLPCSLSMPAVSSTECGCGLDPSLLHVTLDHVFSRHLSPALIAIEDLA